MKTGFSFLLLGICFLLFLRVTIATNSPVILQPLATKNYFLYRVYIVTSTSAAYLAGLVAYGGRYALQHLNPFFYKVKKVHVMQ